RARHAAAGPARAEHEVVDEQLRAVAEEVLERRRTVCGLEHVVLLDGHPRQVLPAPREFVALAGVGLLGLQQLGAGLEPLRAGCGLHARAAARWPASLSGSTSPVSSSVLRLESTRGQPPPIIERRSPSGARSSWTTVSLTCSSSSASISKVTFER